MLVTSCRCKERNKIDSRITLYEAVAAAFIVHLNDIDLDFACCSLLGQLQMTPAASSFILRRRPEIGARKPLGVLKCFGSACEGCLHPGWMLCLEQREELCCVAAETSVPLAEATFFFLKVIVDVWCQHATVRGS
ncbi:hypothetical protein XENOCAPTIV_018031 [Xenoophorus captivus]|uniref:Uncharacterized protein n=1 Tax=Xenoophorus captivus TaxID=1517983 RepID=A0ABV0R9C1_9TELE